MTANQINYWRNVETERSNRRNEQIKAHEADTKRMAFRWQKEYETALAYLAAVNAGSNFVDATMKGFKNLAGGIKDFTGAAGNIAMFA